MKTIFKIKHWLGLTSIAVVLAMASTNGFAQSSSASTSPRTPAASMTAPSISKAAPATPASLMSEDIRDIRGPKHIASPWLWPLWLTGGAMLAGLLYAGWRWNRRRTLIAALLPYEIALAKLEEARRLMQPENAREFSITVSEIVRHYIEVRFQVWAARRTTEEFLHDVVDQSDAMLTDHRELLDDFLRHCDLAKFARWILSVEEMENMLQSAHTFVLKTGRSPAPKTKSTELPVPEKAPAMAEPSPTSP